MIVNAANSVSPQNIIYIIGIMLYYTKSFCDRDTLPHSIDRYTDQTTSGLMLTVDTGSSFTLDQHLDQQSINTWLTLDCTQLTLDGHSMAGHLDQHSLDQNLIDTQLILNWHSINSQLMVGSVDWLNQQSVACLWKLVYCWSSVDWVSI